MTERFKFTTQMEQEKVIVNHKPFLKIFLDSSEMVAQKKFVKLQKQLKSTREAVDEAVREQIEKPDPSKSNVKGTLHFLKVASVSHRFLF